MKTHSLFRAPTFDDPEDTRQAGLLHPSLLLMLSFCLALSAAGFVLLPANVGRFSFVAISTTLVVAMSMTLLYRGSVKTAGVIFVSLFWAIVTTLCITGGGSTAPVFVAYTIVVLTAGLLLGIRLGIVTAAVCSVSEILLIIAEANHLLPPSSVLHTPYSLLAAHILFFAWVIAYVFLYRRSLDSALSQSKYELAERVRSEHSIRESEAALKDAQRIAHVGSSSWDARTDTTIWSDELYRIVGWDRTRPAPTHTERAKIYTPESFAKLDAAVKKSLAGGEPYDLELEIIRPDGGHRHVRARGGAVHGNDGAVSALHGTLQDITDQKRAQLELVASEELFRVAFQSATAGVCLVGADGKFRNVNRTMCQLIGYDEDELRKLTFNDLTHAEDKKIGSDFVSDALAGKAESIEFEKRYIHRDGHVVWAFVSTAVVRRAVDDGTLFITYVQDITEQKAADLALKTNEERFRTLIEKAPTAIHVSRNGKVTYANQKFLEVYRFRSLDELIGTPVEQHWSEEWRPIIKERMRLRDQGAPVPTSYEAVGMRADGSLFPVVVEVASVELPDGPARLGFFTDISDRKQAEEKIKESEERYRGLIDSAQDAVYTVSPDGFISSLNPAFERITGWKREEWIGKHLKEAVHPNDVPRVVDSFNRILGGEPTSAIELRIASKAGGYVTGEFLSYPQTKEGKIVGVLGIARDVTERKTLEEQLRRTQRLDSIGSLASGIAHDLNNVLAPILLSLEILGRRANAEQDSSLIDAIRTSAKRGSEIVKQVLTFARGNEGEFAPQQLRYTVKEIGSFVKQTFPKNINFQTDIPGDLNLINGDQTQLHQVLLNFCVNARDAMPDGGSVLIEGKNVTLSAQELSDQPGMKPGQYVALAVSDTGMGIPPEIRAKIFEPFFTTKELGKGTGLGLSTVFGIIRGHNGFLKLDSEVGKGTTFTAYFPVSTKGGAKQEDKALGASPRGNGEGILVVDDELSILRIAKETLQAYGYTVETAASGIEALTILSDKPGGAIALVLTDYNMPGMDGAQVARQLRRFNPGIKILVTTGSVEDLSHFKGTDIDEFLPKPFTAEQMLECVHKLLQQR